MTNIKIYQAFHKSYLHNPIADWIQPVAVGSYDNPLFAKDSDGHNISKLNSYYCELTVLYWAWKNQQSDFVGLYHYRRYLSYLPDNAMNNPAHMTRADETQQNVDYLTSQNQKAALMSKLEAYDFVIPRKFTQMPSVGVLYQQLHRPEPWLAFISALKKTYSAKRVESYFAATDRTTICNIFVTSRANFEKYCEELFAIVDEAYRQIGTPFTDWHNRYPGFLAERFLGFWLHTHRMTAAEVPLIHIGE